MIDKKDSVYWRSLESLDPDAATYEELHREFPVDASEETMTATSRRSFMGVMGAGMALAGGLMSGCIRKPQEKIYPYNNRPENTIPGRPKYFATSAPIAGVVSGFLIESHDGRPTKLEGNPDHPMSLGAASAQAQASILDLYDPERAQGASAAGAAIDRAKLDEVLAGLAAAAKADKGAGLAVLVEHRPSPTYQRLLGELKKAYPEATVYKSDATDRVHARAGMALAGVKGLPFLHLGNADRVLAIDSDILGYEGEGVANARAFADGRRVSKPGDKMNRLYAVEPQFSITGAMADHRLRSTSTDIGGFVSALVDALAKAGVNVDVDAKALAVQKVKDVDAAFVGTVAKDLAEHKGKSLVTIGERHSAELHAVVALINDALGATGKTVSYVPELDSVETAGLSELVEAAGSNKIRDLVILGANPVYTAPGDLDVAAAIAGVNTVVVSSYVTDETAAVAKTHVAVSHYLESWGDWQATDGTVSVQQPLIAPLFDTVSELEVLARLLGSKASSHELVTATWEDTLSGKAWRKALHDGVAVAAKASKSASPSASDVNKALAALKAPVAINGQNLEVNFVLDSKLVDGRNANNGWLQELPDSMTKLTWDNAALMSVKTAAAFGIKKTPKQSGVQTFDMVALSIAGKTLEIAAFVSPGLADDMVVLNLGYGRKNGQIATGAGVDVSGLRTQAAPDFAAGITVKKTGGRYPLASTQDHWYMGPDHKESSLFENVPHERPIVREITKDAYKKHPEEVEHMGPHVPHHDNLWTDVQDYSKGQQWGMAIDLNACTGCNACAIACQSENNIPIVRKERVLKGREMHWIRMDRYYRGTPDNPTAVFQPMACAHCENAPCESVCPVAATTHSPDGLNDMAYNRCIGTRYCSNNCPYKVRRFNFFAYNRDEDVTSPNPFLADDKKLSEISKMQKNPDVTVRFRGVMEKCTYCVQRINQAKIDAKVTSDGIVKDGDIVPACQQTCPSGAIVFGDQNDPKSRVSILKKQERDYELLGELNLRTRTTYLARLRNPHPALAPADAHDAHGDGHGHEDKKEHH